jgi:putative DNA primase/helicase
MEVASAVAEGRDAMNCLWPVEKAAPVFFVDGEMDPHDLKDRGRFFNMHGCFMISKMKYDDENWPLRFNLKEEEIRQFITEQIEKNSVKLLILDNIYSLISNINHNSENDWQPINAWLLNLRLMGAAVIVIHHTGKSGSQLGTSARVFNVDYNFKLKKAGLPEVENGTCCFSVDIENQRRQIANVAGRVYVCTDGIWEVVEIDDEGGGSRSLESVLKKKRIANLLVEGKHSQKEIAEIVGVSAAWVSTVKKELFDGGFLEIQEDGTVVFTDKGNRWFSSEPEVAN